MSTELSSLFASLLGFADSDAAYYSILIVKIVLACLMVVCAGFIIFVVLRQSGNSDASAVTGGKRDEQESYYGKGRTQTKDQKLKMWTYICGGCLALFALVFIILTAVVG